MELDKMWWLESGTSSEDALGPYDADLHEELLQNARLKQPETRTWFALVEGEPRAFFSLWPRENSVGIVENLFCHPEYRHRGLASARLAHCVTDTWNEAQARVIIRSDFKETPKHLYARVGFRPFFVGRSYLKKL
jgi:predicted GNAT family acetyltransferase